MKKIFMKWAFFMLCMAVTMPAMAQFNVKALKGAAKAVKAVTLTDAQMAEGAEAQARQSLENIKHILGEAGLTMANIVKTTVFLQDMSLFADMNKVYATYFDGDFPARSAVAVKALPKDALVEIECIAVR